MVKALKKLYKETFKSPFGKKSESDALKVLDKIRKAHPESKGWEELKGYVEKHEDGLYYAVRVHQHIAS